MLASSLFLAACPQATFVETASVSSLQNLVYNASPGDVFRLTVPQATFDAPLIVPVGVTVLGAEDTGTMLDGLDSFFVVRELPHGQTAVIRGFSSDPPSGVPGTELGRAAVQVIDCAGVVVIEDCDLRAVASGSGLLALDSDAVFLNDSTLRGGIPQSAIGFSDSTGHGVHAIRSRLWIQDSICVARDGFLNWGGPLYGLVGLSAGNGGRADEGELVAVRSTFIGGTGWDGFVEGPVPSAPCHPPGGSAPGLRGDGVSVARLDACLLEGGAPLGSVCDSSTLPQADPFTGFDQPGASLTLADVDYGFEVQPRTVSPADTVTLTYTGTPGTFALPVAGSALQVAELEPLWFGCWLAEPLVFPPLGGVLDPGGQLVRTATVPALPSSVSLQSLWLQPVTFRLDPGALALEYLPPAVLTVVP